MTNDASFPPPAQPLPPPTLPDRSRPRSNRLPLIVGAAVAIVALSVGAIVLIGGSGGGGDGCLVDLGERLPDGAYLEGADLDRARQAGYDDDGDLQQLFDAQMRTGALPDPVTRQALTQFRPIDAEATGFVPGDVSCWVGTVDDALLEGDFDPAAIETSEWGGDGNLAAAGGVVAVAPGGEAEQLFEDGDGDGDPSAAHDAVAALDDADVYSFSGFAIDSGDDEPRWAGLSILDGEDGREIVAVWVYVDDDAAEADFDALRGRVDEGDLDEVMRVDADEFERQGNVTVLQGRLQGDANRWTAPIQLFDPAFRPREGG